ncbi:probable inactive receptor kinase At1g48480 [Andrographis paniculata]|uniref:probable inactive receptor kinase At1g48480 n=1 Tax=Andrographis paniculata TaxID=175694 RepID=UPI0021E7B322|nr:probable inactive receptor kinase At1g48480 [Andrographis paniculata]
MGRGISRGWWLRRRRRAFMARSSSSSALRKLGLGFLPTAFIRIFMRIESFQIHLTAMFLTVIVKKDAEISCEPVLGNLKCTSDEFSDTYAQINRNEYGDFVRNVNQPHFPCLVWVWREGQVRMHLFHKLLPKKLYLIKVNDQPYFPCIPWRSGQRAVQFEQGPIRSTLWFPRCVDSWEVSGPQHPDPLKHSFLYLDHRSWTPYSFSLSHSLTHSLSLSHRHTFYCHWFHLLQLPFPIHHSQSQPTMLLLLLLSLLALLSHSSSDLSGDRAALLALRSAVGGRTLFWNTNLSTPCNWAGVLCEANRVTVLRLPAASLSGTIPTNTLSNLTSLRTLSLRLNHLSGPLPDDISALSQLRNLYLQGNQFSGPTPEFIFSLHSLVRLNLASNSFSGEIPPGFNNLTRLRTLYLESNQFTGTLPSIDLPNLDQFNVSFNNLNGSVPKGLQGKPREAFLGTFLCGKPLDSVCADNAGESPAIPNGSVDLGKGGRRKLSGGAIAGIVIGSVVGLLLICLILFVLCRKRSRSKARSVDVVAIKSQVSESGEKPIAGDAENGNGGVSNGFSVAAAAAAALSANGNSTSSSKVENGANSAAASKKLVFFGNASRVFDLEDLLRASAEVLGKGTFGTAYKAVLEVGTVAAVKRLKDVTISDKEFKEKIEVVGAMDHENLVPLLAYYYSREEKLLVYDYMPMGSLSALLHGNKGARGTPLNWEVRSGIALGAARGIEYLHFQGQNISHGNIKSSNILLTKSYEARVSDFGLNHLVAPSSSPTRVAGYRAPEVTDPRRVSQKADVYSFGVLILELLTGKAPAHALLNEEGVDLPRWVQSVVREEWTSEVFDLELLRYQNVEDEMVQLLQLGIDCTAQYPDQRPSISEVANRIEELRRSSLRENYQEQPDQVSETERD